MVLLYSRKIWVVTMEMIKALEGFYHKAVGRITGVTAKPGVDGERYYPSVVEAMESEGLHPIGVYIRRR